FFRQRQYHAQPPSLLTRLIQLDPAPQILDLLIAEPAQLAERTSLDQAAEVVDIFDAELLVKHGERLRPDAWDVHHLDQFVRDGAHLPFAAAYVTGLDVLLDHLRKVMADARYLFELLLARQSGHVLIQTSERTGGALVGQRAKTVFAFEEKHARHMVEYFRDLLIYHLDLRKCGANLCSLKIKSRQAESPSHRRGAAGR